MPNTKSAAKRARSSARKAQHNRSIKSRVKSLEKGAAALLTAGKVEEARQALKKVAGAYDKAAKSGVIAKGTASRKRSRLQLRLNKAAATAPK